MLAKGKKVSIVLKEHIGSRKKSITTVNGIITNVNKRYVTVKTENYTTCINLIDFKTGHAVLS
jgi:hypothetical protein